jgi:hypothetical protein
MSRALFLAGVVVLLFAAIATIGVRTNSDVPALRLVPALFLPLPDAFVGGGDFPKSLNQAGVLVVYGLPAACLLALAWLARRRTS